ncbi:MFS transporter [Legionella jamestowniensis]|uniref:MFS transporter n=1 Tax=Legionella jamestowniensis TaxID=455 RepID=A0A0W0UGX0_9GAMM|nr:MFS transporter [Legionella jamestowniensis]KTD06793.1 major facilitator superfamily (MFS) transporter [Legionella jamestowniensis]OCH97246.1 MFS transporter [Legionella jamestowniensis]SFL83186.1 Predicted arabinose efflux permease, MFS family [Legionella jamestowniensis DSM 19215]
MISKFRIAWLLSYISIASFSAAIITPALPQIQLQFGLANGQVEWVVSAFLAGYVIGQLIYGPLANRWGRVGALRIGLSINLLGLLLCFFGLAQSSFLLLSTGRLVSALGAASGLACTYMLINEWLHETQRATAMAYSILSFTIGIGLAVALGSIITEYWQWSLCFLVLLGHGIIMLGGTCLFRETLKEAQAINCSKIITNYCQAVSSGKLMVFSLVIGLCSAMGYCFSAAGPQIANDILHLRVVDYGSWNFLNMLGMLIGGLWAKALVTRLSAQKMIVIGLIGSLGGIVSLIVMLELHSSSAGWFFFSTMSFYIFGALLFSGGSILASTAINDKANGAAMMSFINMFSATIAVIVMGYASANPLKAFIDILLGMWILVVGLLVWHYYHSCEQNKQLQKVWK